MTIRVQSNVEINEVEQEITFEFDYSPAEQGSRDYYGQQNEPDTCENMRFYAAYDQNGEEIEITCKQEIECAREMAFEEVYGFQNEDY